MAIANVSPVQQLGAALKRILFDFAVCWGRLEQAPERPGYEAFFRANGDPSLAKVHAQIVWHYGRVVLEEHLAERKGASLLRDLRRQKTELTIARRAGALWAGLEPFGGLEVLAGGCERAAISYPDFEKLVRAAMARNPQGLQLPQLAARLVPHLPNPNSKATNIIAASHEMLLALCNDGVSPRSFTYSDLLGVCVDPLTRATEAAFGVSKFDPRPLHRRMVKQGHLTSRWRLARRPG